MIEIVIDASAALAAVLRSQMTGASRQFIASRGDDRYVAPHIFYWEISNALVRLHRRGLLSRGAYGQAISDVQALDVEVQLPMPDAPILALGQRALDLGIRPFDAAYLFLAIERDCALASRDDQLINVARRFVPCLDLQGEQLT